MHRPPPRPGRGGAGPGRRLRPLTRSGRRRAHPAGDLARPCLGLDLAPGATLYVGHMATELLGVADVTRLTGLTRKALRHYEEVGLVGPDERTAAGYRRYGPEALRRLELIRRARLLGLFARERRVRGGSGSVLRRSSSRADGAAGGQARRDRGTTGRAATAAVDARGDACSVAPHRRRATMRGSSVHLQPHRRAGEERT